jgi:hypothetical protein
VSRRQFKRSTGGSGQVTLDQTPVEGNLLVATSFHRQAGASADISGAGWTERVLTTQSLTEDLFRRGLAIWTKVAGAGEPTAITTTWNPSSQNELEVTEYQAGAAVTWSFLEQASNVGADASTDEIATGTTPSVSPGQHLIHAHFGARNGSNNDISGVTMSDPPIDPATVMFTNAGPNARSMGSGFGQDASAGAKSATISWTNSDETGGDPTTEAVAAILVFGMEAS